MNECNCTCGKKNTTIQLLKAAKGLQSHDTATVLKFVISVERNNRTDVKCFLKPEHFTGCLCQNHFQSELGIVNIQLKVVKMERTRPEVFKTSKIIENGPMVKDIGEML